MGMSRTTRIIKPNIPATTASTLVQGVYKFSLTNFQEISKTHLTNFQ